jgi:DNA modification methylase
MNVEMMAVKDIKPFERNAKKHDEKQIKNVMESIKQFGFAQPLVVSKDNVLIIGHCRLIASKRLKLDKVPVVKMDELTQEQVDKLRLLDNKLNESEWDFDLLSEDIPTLDFSDFDIDWELPNETEETTGDNVEHKSLTDRFVVPPFSILDTRQGYWQDRKRAWKALGIKSEVGRKENLIDAPDLPQYADNGLKGIAVQTSIFDPVLAEIMYRWFNKDGGLIYDCFAGGSVRGIVAAKLGYEYIGIDLRQEQVDANREQAQQLELSPVWQCDDSQNADAYIENETADLLFTCPPYADLEVYSDDARDISNMDYEGFKKTYKDILSIACRKLKKNRFAIIVIGDVRDKQGAYRNLIDYTKECMLDNGLKTYNEFILIEQIGTGALRAKHQFEGMRKAIKTHQNVLVFYKGDIKRIKDELGTLEIDDDVFDEKE